MLGRFIALIFFSTILLFIVASPYQDLVAVRISADSRLEQKSINERIDSVWQAKDLIKNNIVLGSGIGNYTNALSEQAGNKKPAWANQPVHNVFLLIFAENGIFALLFFIGFLICLILKDRREVFSWAIFISIIILLMVDHWLISLPFGVLFLFLILGFI
jgi:O-antigen ligase